MNRFNCKKIQIMKKLKIKNKKNLKKIMGNNNNNKSNKSQPFM